VNVINVPELEEVIAESNVQAKILLLDIETAPMEVYVWGLYKQRINPDNVIKDWSCLSWAAKWLCDDKVMSDRVNVREAAARDDYRIMTGMWQLLEEADIVIGHNAARFDLRKLNARFIQNGLKPPMPYQIIDTLKECRKHFAFSSNKLDYVSALMDGGAKLHTDFDLWKRCVTGDKEALKEMETYNRQDVVALEDVYFAIRPWIKSHANMGLYVESEDPVCPTCGSENLTWKGHYYTQAGKYRAFRCHCGAIGRYRSSDLPKETRPNMARSVAR